MAVVFCELRDTADSVGHSKGASDTSVPLYEWILIAVKPPTLAKTQTSTRLAVRNLFFELTNSFQNFESRGVPVQPKLLQLAGYDDENAGSKFRMGTYRFRIFSPANLAFDISLGMCQLFTL